MVRKGQRYPWLYHPKGLLHFWEFMYSMYISVYCTCTAPSWLLSQQHRVLVSEQSASELRNFSYPVFVWTHQAGGQWANGKTCLSKQKHQAAVNQGAKHAFWRAPSGCTFASWLRREGGRLHGKYWFMKKMWGQNTSSQEKTSKHCILTWHSQIFRW